MRQPDPSRAELTSELLAEIAVGATARVELCEVTSGPREGSLVAVKRLHPHIADDPQFLDMFRDEVWMTASLKHPHVVEVVGWGEDHVGPWLAVEFVRGVSLQRLMKTVFDTGEHFTERMVVYLARSVCDGLAAAHGLRSAAGAPLDLVHRDLTPGNILLGFSGEVKITDFGLAKAKQRLTKTLTGLLKGQPQYMSPEQIQGGTIDGRSDLFALGVVLFELFSGRRPWRANTDLDAMRAISDDTPADLLALRPKIDPALVDVVMKCLEKEPAQRWQSAAELRQRFDDWLGVHGYRDENDVALARFVRRNAMRQMRWFERAIAGEYAEDAKAGRPPPPEPSTPDDEVATMSDTEDEDIDWGDDGPTLVQRSSPSRRAAIRKAKEEAKVKLAEARRQRDAETAKQPKPRRPRAKTARMIDGVGERVRDMFSGAPGVVAPDDPAAPPVPEAAPTQPRRTSIEDPETRDERGPRPAMPPRPGSAASPPAPPRPGVPPSQAPGVSETAATRPMTRDQATKKIDAATSVPPEPPPPPEALEPPPPATPRTSVPAPRISNLAPMPAPAVPSIPGDEGGELGVDAVRMIRSAEEAAREARAAAEYAAARGEVAALAAEALQLIGAGQPHNARAILRRAREVEEAFERGEALPRRPSSIPSVPVPADDAEHDRLAEQVRRLTVAVAGLVVVVLLIVLGSLF